VVPTTPVITWATPAAIVYGTALSATQLDATASVAGSFSYSPAAGTVPAAGSQKLTVTFTPSDTTDYTSASGSVTLTVNQATPAISWATPASISYGTALSATQLDATASVGGSFSYSPAVGQVLAVGNQTLSTNFTPTDTVDYTPATASVTLAVTKQVPAITWADPAAITYGTALSATQLNATASVAGTFAYSPSSGTTLTAGEQMLSVTFTPTDTADYQSATSDVMLTVNKATPVITWATPASVIAGTSTLLGSTQLDATANVPGSFVYSPAAGTVLGTAETLTLSTTFTPNDATDYTTATDSVSLVVTAPTPTTTVDFGTTYQTIRGFGGSTAWLGELTTQQATALFSTTSGLGLSILRVRIDPTGSAATNNWATTNWAQELTNAQEAQAANPNAIVFASPWTPPTTMKTSSTSQPSYSGTAACSPGPNYCGGYLNPTSYGAYANYLEDFVQYMAAGNPAVNLYGISMQNEPDYSAQATENYESCSWTAQQMDTWIDSDASVLTTKLIMPESYNFSTAQASASLSDATAEGLIGIVAGHLYGVSPSYYTQAENAGKDVWMTEHALMPAGSQPTITDALAAAEEVHNSMVTGQYNAYVWWWIWDDPSDGVNYGLINSNTTSPTPTYYGYAIGQFSEFIQPGYQRVSATANPATSVYVSAYAGAGHFVIVAINAGNSAVSQSFTLQNGSVTSMTPYSTTSSGGLTAQTAVSVSSGAFTYSLPAQSITTFLQ
jgi:O-glycosyl hydrolase